MYTAVQITGVHRLRRMRCFVAFVLALAVTGCGSARTGDTGDFDGEEARVAAVVGELSSAATGGEEARVCDDLLSERLAEEVAEDASCVSEVEKAFEDADGFLIDVEDVTIAEGGTEASAEVSSVQVGEDATATFSLVKEDDDWRIDSFG